MFQIQRELEFSKRLREAQAEAGLTQTEAARAMGLSRQHYNNWAHGYCRPKGERMKLLAHVLKCDEQWLRHGEGSEIERRIDTAMNLMRVAVRELNHIHQMLARKKSRSAR
jgi:transcriptional regulator with XRE-family HTH domain